MKYFLILLVVLLVGVLRIEARLPPRNHETEDADKPKTDESPVERTLVNTNDDQSPATQDQKPLNKRPVMILFRQQPAFSLFSNRSPNPFSLQPSLFDLDHDHFHSFGNFHNRNSHDDPAIRLISLLFGRRPTNRQPDAIEGAEATNTSSDTSTESSEDKRDVEPMDSLFPHLFPFPRFPVDDGAEKEGEASTTSDDKTPVNFENKEIKVIEIDGRKFVKTTQTKKVKNDFGQFHSVISSYQPFDEKIHDENGNDKVKPDESSEEKDKKDVDPSTASTEKVDPSSSTRNSSNDNTPSSSTPVDGDASSSMKPEREFTTSTKPELTSTNKEAEKLKLPSESLSNEIPDKNTEIKVDQMN